MEAARVAGLKGHKVTLFEKSDTLGGALNSAGGPKVKDGILFFRDYLIRQMKKEGIEIKLNTEVDNALIEKERPDAVIVATGWQHPLCLKFPELRVRMLYWRRMFCVVRNP
jgi:2-enoate reductase